MVVKLANVKVPTGFGVSKVQSQVNEYTRLKNNYKNLSEAKLARFDKLKTELKKFKLIEQDGSVDNKKFKELSIFDIAAKEARKNPEAQNRALG